MSTSTAGPLFKGLSSSPNSLYAASSSLMGPPNPDPDGDPAPLPLAPLLPLRNCSEGLKKGLNPCSISSSSGNEGGGFSLAGPMSFGLNLGLSLKGLGLLGLSNMGSGLLEPGPEKSAGRLGPGPEISGRLGPGPEISGRLRPPPGPDTSNLGMFARFPSRSGLGMV